MKITEILIEGIPVKKYSKEECKFYFNQTNLFRSILDKGHNKGKQETSAQKDKEFLEMIEELKKRLISRMCCPNKPVNTFENAREQEEVIKEEFEELTQKLGGKK